MKIVYFATTSLPFSIILGVHNVTRVADPSQGKTGISGTRWLNHPDVELRVNLWIYDLGRLTSVCSCILRDDWIRFFNIRKLCGCNTVCQKTKIYLSWILERKWFYTNKGLLIFLTFIFPPAKLSNVMNDDFF